MCGPDYLVQFPKEGKMFKPGKGVRIALTSKELVQDIVIAMDELLNGFCGDTKTKGIPEFMRRNHKWARVENDFGDQAYTEMALRNSNNFRITIVVDPKGELKLDIREWFYEDGE